MTPINSGNNFTMLKEDVLVPSTAAIDSYNYGGYATTNCQAQMQPYQPTQNEIGPDTSMTYHLGQSDQYNSAAERPRND